MKRQEKGITLIALIITILILVILAGVTIHTAIHSGILTTAKDVTEEYKKAKIAEEIKIEMGNIKARNPYLSFGQEFAQKLEHNLEELHDAEYEDSIITATWDSKYYVMITENEVTLTELGTFSNLKENVQAMKEDMDLKEGDMILTKGYYTGGDNGNGEYRIVVKSNQTIDEGRYIQLNNGLLAELVISNNTINVKQYGAYGNGIQDDTEKIQLAFNQLTTQECNQIYFPSGTYIVRQAVAMYSGSYVGNANSKIQIAGRTIGREYAFYNNKEGKSYSGDRDTILLDSLTVTVKMDGTTERDHINMFRFFHTDETQVKNCHFYTEEGNQIGVCPIDLYTDNHHFTLENCDSKIYGAEQALNSHIMVREFYADYTTSDIRLKNYVGEKNGKDESLWIDAWVGKLENVEISNCELKDVGVSSSMIFLGANYNTSAAKHIKMHDCRLIKEQFSNGIFKLAMTEQASAGMTQDVQVYNNTIEILSNLNGTLQAGTSVFQTNTPGKANNNSSDILIANNTVVAEQAKIGTVMRDYSSNYITTTRNNSIKVNNFENNSSYFNGVYSGIKEVDSDQFSKTNGETMVCSYLFRNCKYIHGIQTSVSGKFMNDYHTTVEEVQIKDCNLTVSDVVVNVITTSTNLNTIRLQNCNITNSGNLIGAWYTDVNKAFIDGEGIKVIKQNITATKNSTFGTVTVTEE